MLSSDSVLFPGAAACVKMFAERVPLAIASGALEPEIAIVLDHAGLRGCFKAIASASDGVPGKPAPDLYLLAMAKLSEQLDGGATSAASLRPASRSKTPTGDSRRPAKAGLRCVAVTHTYPASELGRADLIVERLGDLTLAGVEDASRCAIMVARDERHLHHRVLEACGQPRSRPGDAGPDDREARMPVARSRALSRAARCDGRRCTGTADGQRLSAGRSEIGHGRRRAERVPVRRGRLHRQSRALRRSRATAS